MPVERFAVRKRSLLMPLKADLRRVLNGGDTKSDVTTVSQHSLSRLLASALVVV